MEMILVTFWNGKTQGHSDGLANNLLFVIF